MKNDIAIYGGFAGTEIDLSQRLVVNPVSGNPSSSTLSGDIGTVGSTTDNSFHVISNPAGLNNTAIIDGFVITGGNANASSPNNAGGGCTTVGSVIIPVILRCATACFNLTRLFLAGLFIISEAIL